MANCLIGAGVYSSWNYLADPATTITFEGGASATHPATNLGNGDPSKPARFATDAANRKITFDLGSAKTVALFSIHGHNLGPGISRVELRHSTDNFAANDVLYVGITPFYYRSSMYLYVPGGISKRYWRVVFGSLGTNGSPIWIGEATLCNPRVMLAKPLAEPAPTTEHEEAHVRYTTPTGRKIVFERTAWETRYETARFKGTHSGRDEVLQHVYRASRADLRPLLFVKRAPSTLSLDGSANQVFDGNERVALLGQLEPPQLIEQPVGPSLIAWSIGVAELPFGQPLA